jgi:hypothetical protein
MEKARFNIFKNKAGKPVIEVIFSDGKKMSFTQNLDHSAPLSLNGKEIDVEREKGQIIKIICEGKVLFHKSNKPVVNSSSKPSPRQNSLTYGNADI